VEEKLAGRNRLPYRCDSSLIHRRIITTQIKLSREKSDKEKFFSEAKNNPKKWFFEQKERVFLGLAILQPKDEPIAYY